MIANVLGKAFRIAIALIGALLFAFAIFGASHSVFGQQETKPASDSVPLPDTDKYHLQAVKYTYDYEALWLQQAVEDWINHTPEPKQHRESGIKAAIEYNKLVEQLWEANKLDKNQYRLDVEQGVFVKNPSLTHPQED